jgi:hypothetical protein
MGILDRFRKQPEPLPDRPPRSAAGRGHTQGFLELEELNDDLRGNAGYEIYDKMYRTDGDVRQVIAMTCNPIAAGTWTVVPHGGKEAKPDAVDQAKFVEWVLTEAMCPGWSSHITEMLPALTRWGHVFYEVTWQTVEFEGKTRLVPRKLDIRLPRTIVRYFQDRYGDLSSIVQFLPVPLAQLNGGVDQFRKASNGEQLHPGEVELQMRDLLYYRVGGEGDNWEGVSFLRPAYKHWYLKDSIEKIDAIAQEREAVGIPICYPPMGATPRQLEEMEHVLAAMRTNDQGYIVAPGPKAGSGAQEGQGWLIEVIGYDKTGSGRDPGPSLDYHTQKIAAAFIAEFMRLGHGQSGARATAQVQVDPFLMSIEALAGLIEEAVQPLVDKIVAYNFTNAEFPPKLKMSLVDSTSLSQLADYVLKLTQVGALLPDQELEDFLRERGDLPPSDPESVKKRGKKDDDLRREIVQGAGPNGDAPGSNQKPGATSGSKTTKAKSSGAGKQMSDGYDDIGRRVRYRSHRPEEAHVDLDGIEDYLDDLPDMFARHCQADVLSGKGCKESVYEMLDQCYHYGAQTIRTELMQAQQINLSVRDMGRDGLSARANLAAKYISDSIDFATASTLLNKGDDEAAIQLAGETAGLRSLRHVAMGHGQGAFLQGRHDAIQLANEQMPERFGIMYNSMLDNNTCVECRHADDGIVRGPDDPVRLDRRPPNHHCLSTNSGHNYCRCLEIIVPMAV